MTDQQPMLLASYDAGDCSLERLKRLGFTVFQYDTDHLSTDEAAPGVWDFGRNGWGGGGKYERIYERIRAQGGKWMPMTHFAWPPEWYRRTRRYTRLACLEHRQTCEAFSIWDPDKIHPRQSSINIFAFSIVRSSISASVNFELISAICCEYVLFDIMCSPFAEMTVGHQVNPTAIPMLFSIF